MIRLLIVLSLATLAGPAWSNIVGDMRVIGDGERTRFVVDLEKSPAYAVSRLENPPRLVIDLPEVEFEDKPEPGQGRGLIRDYFYGLFAPGKARIVLDLTGPVEVVKADVLDPVHPEPARLLIDVVPTSAAEFAAAAAEDRPKLQARAPAGPRAPANRSGKPVVVIDPGHGGIDSGARGEDGLLEKDVTLEFGRELARQIELGGLLEPVLTRDGDDFLPLPERVEFAREQGAKLLISIHADTVAEDYVRGATVYTLSEEATDEVSAALAVRENRSDILAGMALENEPDDVADILIDLTRRETKNFAIRFAESLVKDVDGTITLNSNPLRRAAFRVLKAPDVPSVLLELGYMSNPEDEAVFRSESWPGEQAKAVARAIEEFVAGTVTAGQ